MLADADLDLLRRVITPQQPCGPPDAAQITGSIDLLRLLYDPTNRIHRHAESSGAPYVIGRKGAGKTAFVTAPRLHNEVIAVELPTADIYQGVFAVVTSLMRRELQLYPEHTARLWRHLTWSAVLAAIARRPRQRRAAYRRVRDFAQSLGNGMAPPADAGAAVSQYLRRLRTMLDALDHLGSVGELLNSVEGNGLTMAEAISAGSDVLAAQPERYVVIVDSLERYSGELPTTEYQQVERISFEGLFRFIGGDGTLANRAFDIRFAFPAEMWQVLAKVSSNPVKDFHSTVIAHWSSRELITLVGTRLAIYCHLHHPGLLERLDLPDDHPGDLSYAESRRLIDAMLPAEVVNAFGGREDSVGFLLRHTQLLPRHLIAILNQVFEAHTVDPRAPFPVSGIAVVEGVRRGQAAIVGDIIAAYNRVHPHADLCCERILPNVGLVVEESELHRLYNQRGIRKATGLDYQDMRRVLIEIGCLGRVVEVDSTARYVVGEFEYTRPGSLHVAESEPLCVHPLFGEVYSCRHSSSRRSQLTAEERRAVRPVYPVGSDPDAARDYRDYL
jgi:hypothetical protein